jgi:16S rRNA (guanine527-N7)-methyltransferase
MDLLIQGCEVLGIELSQEQIAQFEGYCQLLREWNQKINLTAIDDYEGVQTKHFLDSLVALPLIGEEQSQAISQLAPLRAIDVGAGAGFPGLPLKIAWPSLDLTLLDGTGKKIRFMETVVAELGLTGVKLVQGRAEEIAHQEDFRGQYDLVLARAVARLNTLAEYLLPFGRLDGLVVIYKGPGAAQEFVEAGKAIQTLGGETVRFAPVRVPFLDEERRVLLIRKVRKTPGTYPRQQGLPRKQPL